MAGKDRDIAREAENLLAGLTIDGRRAARRFLFCRDEATRRQAVILACEVMGCVRARAPMAYDNDRAREQIMRRLFIHLVRARRQTPASIWVFTRHAVDAVWAMPIAASQRHVPIIFAGLLRMNTPPMHAAKLFLPQDTPPRPVLWESDNGMFRLEELTHPFHVMAEGFALGHCIDTKYHPDLEKHGVKPGTFASGYYLEYWCNIRQRRSLTFSFGDADGPLVTINFDRERRAIDQLGPRKNAGMSPKDVFFPYLIQAIEHLARIHGPLSMGAEDQPFFAWSDVLVALVGKPGITISKHPNYTRVQRMARGLT